MIALTKSQQAAVKVIENIIEHKSPDSTGFDHLNLNEIEDLIDDYELPIDDIKSVYDKLCDKKFFKMGAKIAKKYGIIKEQCA